MQSVEKTEKSRLQVTLKDSLICLAVLAGCTIAGVLFRHVGLFHTNIVSVYLLGVMAVSAVTGRRIYGFASALAATLLYKFFFLEPINEFGPFNPAILVTFLAMFLAAWLVGRMAVSIQKHAVREKEAQEKARAEQLKSELVRTISHDLRTPLTAVFGCAENLLNNGDSYDRETLRGIYSDIYNDAAWLINIVENILANTRVGERPELNRTTELLDDLIEEAVRTAHPDKQGRSVNVLPSEDMLLVKVEANLIVQVLVNLFDNAFKYTPAGTMVTVSYKRSGSFAEISVSDEGPGISDEEKEEVFEQFYTGSGNGYSGRKGLGLGLPLCKTIIQSHGGSICVKDTVPTGATFIFTLPIEEVEINE